MKKLIFAAILLAPPALFAQTEGDYPHQLTDVAVRLDGGSVVASGGSGSMATDDLWNVAGDLAYATANNTATVLGAGSATQVLHSGATPSWAAVTLTTDVTGLLPYANLADGTAISVLGHAANSSGVNAPIQCAAAGGGVIRESGSALSCGTVATAGIANSAITLAKIANAAGNVKVLGSGTAGSGAAYTEISATGAGSTITTNPAGTATLGFSLSKNVLIYDDFIFPITAGTDPGGFGNWAVSSANSPGSFVAGTVPTSDHQSYVIFGTGVAGNNGVQFIRTQTSAFAPAAGLVGECVVNVSATTVGSVSCGFNDSTTDPTTGTDSMTLYTLTGTNNHWQIRARAAGTGGAVESNLVVATGWHRLTVYVETAGNGSKVGSVHYYVDGTELNVSPLTANVPEGTDALGFECGYNQTGGSAGAAEIMRLDAVAVYAPVNR